MVIGEKQRKGCSRYTNVKGVKKEEQIKQNQEWEGYSYDIKEPPTPILSLPKFNAYKSKAVDEDLYKIPPEYLHVKPKRVFFILHFIYFPLFNFSFFIFLFFLYPFYFHKSKFMNFKCFTNIYTLLYMGHPLQKKKRKKITF